MKRKIYLMPKIEIISIHTDQMIAVSGLTMTMDNENHVTSGNQVYSRSLNGDWDDEDE